VLVVTERDDEATVKSLRNVPEVHLLVADQLNTYDVLVSDDVIFTEGALAAFLEGPTKGAKAVATESEAETAEETAK
jgi:large subunit ribosomal protein L4